MNRIQGMIGCLTRNCGQMFGQWWTTDLIGFVETISADPATESEVIVWIVGSIEVGWMNTCLLCTIGYAFDRNTSASSGKLTLCDLSKVVIHLQTFTRDTIFLRTETFIGVAFKCLRLGSNPKATSLMRTLSQLMCGLQRHWNMACGLYHSYRKCMSSWETNLVFVFRVSTFSDRLLKLQSQWL